MLTRSRHGGGPIYALFSVTLVSLGNGLIFLGARKEACHERICPQILQSQDLAQRIFAFVQEWEAWAILFETNTPSTALRPQRRALQIYEPFTMSRLGKFPSVDGEVSDWTIATTGGDTSAPRLLDCGGLASLSPSVYTLSFGGFILVIEAFPNSRRNIEDEQRQIVPVPRPRTRGNPRGRVPRPAPRQCLSCGTNDTSQWTESRHLCNACSLQRMRQERRRVETIPRRGPSSSAGSITCVHGV